MDARWPLSNERKALVARLAELIRRFGSTRFLATRLVAADTTDFPDRWEPTLHAVHAVIYRLLWHAHLAAEVIVDDAREPTLSDHELLKDSVIEVVTVRAGCATYRVDAIGNDDVAALLSHSIGQLFLELAPGEPFRDARHESSETDHALAAIYLGLGVLVANGAMYRRHQQRWDGTSLNSPLRTEERIDHIGDLSLDDATLLVAIQDLFRDDAQPALDSLHEPQRDGLAVWRELLEPHEDELRALLGLDDAPTPELPDRSATPRTPPVTAEPDLRARNTGEITFRVRRHRIALPGVGMLAGLTAGAFIAGAWVAAPTFVLAAVGGVVGRLLAGKRYECSEPECVEQMPRALATCPRCGGTIAETIAHPRDRLERREQLRLAAGKPASDDA